MNMFILFQRLSGIRLMYFIVIASLLLGGGLEGFHIYFTKSIHNHDFDAKQVMLSLMCKEEISEKTKGE